MTATTKTMKRYTLRTLSSMDYFTHNYPHYYDALKEKFEIREFNVWQLQTAVIVHGSHPNSTQIKTK